MGCCLGELQDKEVINTCDGKRLGYLCDVEMDLCTGRITALLVPRECGLFSHARNYIRIPWERICRIGRDLILVEMPQNELCPPEGEKREKFRFFSS